MQVGAADGAGRDVERTDAGGAGTGLVLWSRRLLPQQSSAEDRPILVPSPEEERETAETFQAGRRGIQRRGLLGGLLATALGALGPGTVWPA